MAWGLGEVLKGASSSFQQGFRAEYTFRTCKDKKNSQAKYGQL